MKRFFFAGAVALVLLVLTGLVVRYFTAKKDSLLEQNVEALAEQEGGSTGCYGPKKQTWYFQIICKCENDVPCQDLHGCQ